MTARIIALTAALVLAAGFAAGCGGGGDEDSGTSTVERTRVQVVEGLGGENGFDPTTIYERLSPGVVTITSLFSDSDSLSELLEGGGAGQGSGFVLDDDGFVATNAHVITNGTGSKLTKARQVYVQFSDGNQVEADVVGYDPNADVGVIKVNPKGLELVPLELGRTADVRVGEPVAAIGSPFGEEGSLSIGVVSAKNRTIEALTDFSISDAIQTDAAVNRGNSGGPLLDARGRVIGINSQIRSTGGGSVGVGFAVSVDNVRRSIDQIRDRGEARYAYIGISSQNLYPQLAARLDVPVRDGALIADVVENGPADKAGIKGGGREIRFQASLVKLGGDVITKVNGRRVTRQNDFSEQIGRFSPGDVISLELYRGSERRTARVTLGERPD
ncbi:MAG TPA: trypsin-like peptidase domain-containing protein [Solirubrobacterales bacterium]|nr:trypsin-like peptidase domain-containing protein [Solirubrobacterales bacterium]